MLRCRRYQTSTITASRAMMLMLMRMTTTMGPGSASRRRQGVILLGCPIFRLAVAGLEFSMQLR